MKEYNRREHLKQLHKEKKENTYKKIDNAIQWLIKAGETINFNSVANQAKVSKATLYNNIEVRNRIELLRNQQKAVATPKEVKREMDDNNKDATIASLKRKVKKLDEENKQLRDQLKISYGDVWKNI